MKYVVLIVLALSACQPTSNTLAPVPNGGVEPEPTVATNTAAQKVEAVTVSTVEGLDEDQERVVANAMKLDVMLAQKPGTLIALENFAAEGAMAWIWKDGDGLLIKAVVESKGETYDSVDSVYFQGGKPVFARRFHFANPAKFDEAGSETYDAAMAARSAESTLFFFKEGKVAAVSSTGAQPAKQDAELDADSRLVEWPIKDVKGLDPSGEEFSAAVASIHETLGVLLK